MAGNWPGVSNFPWSYGYCGIPGFSPNGKILVSASQDQTLKLWQISPNLQVGNQSDPIQTLTGHTGGIGTVAYSPSEDLIVSGSTDGTIKLWRQRG